MQIQFDSAQPYQRDAIDAVLDVFAGQPHTPGFGEFVQTPDPDGLFPQTHTVNALHLAYDALLDNVRAVQKRNGLPESDTLATNGFSLEMETGTGKTYVYLRTIYDLYLRCGFRKFVIVVPSVAVREGVQTTIRLTEPHFRALYANQLAETFVYDSAQASRLRTFAESNTLQIMIINIQAFDKKDISKIHQDSDKLSGQKPIEFVQRTRPIVILDEPQTMASQNALNSINSLHPLCTLRYSATLGDKQILLYRLDPVQAYDLKLVKRIEIASVLETTHFNRPFLRLHSVESNRTGIKAVLELDAQGANHPIRKKFTLKHGSEDLYALSGQRELYKNYVVRQIDVRKQSVEFANGVVLTVGETQNAPADDLFRLQIRETIQSHLKKELAISKLPVGQRLKVLSLFFIDKVAHYAPADSLLRVMFEDEYAKLAALPDYHTLNLPAVADAHNGYFAADRTGPKDSSGKTQADDEAYALIMRDKERLLDIATPLRFIFSHSALREGWDNPNVFQICTLREMHSERLRRQTVGRGLRLPVREDGLRSFDPDINRLTVIADESFAEFAKALQDQIETETGVDFTGRIVNTRDRRIAILNETQYQSQEFQTLWAKISGQTRYRVHYDTADLIKQATKRLNDAVFVTPPRFEIEHRDLEISQTGITGQVQSVRAEYGPDKPFPLPDLLGFLVQKTNLTRHTLAAILTGYERLADIPRNPQQFLDEAAAAINHVRHSLMVGGIAYEKITDSVYAMQRLRDKPPAGYKDRLENITNGLYDFVECDSQLEHDFAKAQNGRKDIPVFLKLPDWFTIKTPLGDYNPDWAIVYHPGDTLYLVRETKGYPTLGDVPDDERAKIHCGQKHFAALGFDGFQWTNKPAIP